MKFLFFAIGLLANTIMAQNDFSISSVNVNVDSDFEIEVDLDNSDYITAFQFDISYDADAYELISGSSLSNRADNHSMSINTVNESTIRVLVYSNANAIISSGEGKVLTLNFTSKNKPGTYPLNVSNIVVSNQVGQEIPAVSSNGSIEILGPQYQLTTASLDFGEIPIGSTPTELVTITNLGNQDLEVLSYSIDTPFSIDQDFPVTISPGSSQQFTLDINTANKQLVTKNLSFTTNDEDPLRSIQSLEVSADIFAVNEIYVGSAQGDSNTDLTIPISVSNMELFSGLQFDVILPEDVTYVENSAQLSPRGINHIISGNVIESNILRFVVYSPTNENFTGNSGEVFNFKINPNLDSGTYQLPIENPIISNIEIGDILSDAYNGDLSINAPYLSSNVQTIDFGNIPITEIRTSNVILTNTGSANLVIDELVYDSSALSFPLTIPTILSADQNTTVELEFEPTEIGIFDEDISIRNNSAEEQKIIKILANVFSPNYLKILDRNTGRGVTTDISLNLSNNEAVKGIQFDLVIPSGFLLDIDNISETSILNNFSMSVSEIDDNIFRFIIYTLGDNLINNGDETILKLPVFIEDTVPYGSYSFDFTNVILSNASNQNVASDALEVGQINVINDTTNPVITLLGDNPVTIEVGTTYTDAGATASDNVDGDLTADIIVTGSVDTDVVGTYTLSYDVTDSSGNAAETVTRTVNVVDTTIPVITLLGDNPVTIEVGSTYTDAGATASDNADGDLTAAIIVTGSVDADVLGTYTLSYDLTDSSGNAAETLTRTVNVVDTTNPVITLLGDNPVTIEVSTTYTDAGATASDNEEGDLTADIIVTGSVDTDVVGTYTLSYDVTDSSGNAAETVTRTVNVVDTTIPVITLLGENPVTIEVGTTYTDAGATASDNADGDLTADIVVTGSVDADVVGTYTLSYDVTDSSGNAAETVTRTVNVVDTTIPVITLLGDNPVTIEVGSTYTDAGATASDNVDGDLTADIIVTGSVDADVLGTYTLSYDVTDSSGNAAETLTRTVNVVDTTNPVITLLGDNPVTIEVGTTYTDAGATANDPENGDLTADIIVTGSVDADVVGTYALSYDVTDSSGNAAETVTRTVNVVDTTIPVITLLGDNPVTIEVGTTYTDAGATASDNVDGDLTADIIVTGSVDTDVVGTYTLSYDVTDSSGNAAETVTRTVNVVDTTIPVITLLGDNPVTIEVGSTYTDAGATASDNVDGDLTADIIVTGSVDADVVGTYTLSYDVTDSSGNAAETLTRTVNVDEELSINEMEKLKFQLYPNPATHQVTITSNHYADLKALSLYKMLGQKVKHLELSESSATIQINVDDLASGTYLIQLTTKDQQQITKRFIKH
ncbi:hypothetical protein GCM10010831_05410 [Psychroflexus salis]|uniref:Por secretion system C-terminal sorting domain-containing protein n=2 Tax=Psychroflexus salis TaxID=1526574 RepID=A0A916ZPT5_9FLAO|nr:hypothetical protein GCM10010831_05410 [Psychroflexus salis]